MSEQDILDVAWAKHMAYCGSDELDLDGLNKKEREAWDIYQGSHGMIMWKWMRMGKKIKESGQ